MPILQNAAIQDRKRLLELFPLAVFRETHAEIKGTKEEVCYALAERFTPAQMATFIRAHFGRCKQHVYIYEAPDGQLRFPDIASGEKLWSNANVALYIVQTTFEIVLKDPPEEAELEFLFPVLVERKGRNVVVRFVVLEKDVASYFQRKCWVASRTMDEDGVLASLNLGRATDIHRGIKTLWDEGFMDSSRTKYKKPHSLASEAMDEELGIKEHNPALYETLLDSVLLNTLFVIEEEQRCGTSAFLANCQNGFLAFPRYSDAERNTDFVIDEILRRNQ